MIGLIPDREILDQGVTLEVDVTHALRRSSVHNDVDLLMLQQRGKYLWVSGGGTYLLNGRYLLTVQRPIDTKVNPGKFSLFTGRADCPEELLRPDLLIRELFEELILYSGERLYKPVCEEFQGVIDSVYAKLSTMLGLDVVDAVPLPLRAIELATKNVTVIHEDGLWKRTLDFHVSPNKEINILFVLAGHIDLSSLLAQDGEYHVEKGKTIKHKRNVYLYDIQTALGQNISAVGRSQDKVEIPLNAMTGHMRYLVESVSNWLASTSSDNEPQANRI